MTVNTLLNDHKLCTNFRGHTWPIKACFLWHTSRFFVLSRVHWSREAPTCISMTSLSSSGDPRPHSLSTQHNQGRPVNKTLSSETEHTWSPGTDQDLKQQLLTVSKLLYLRPIGAVTWSLHYLKPGLSFYMNKQSELGLIKLGHLINEKRSRHMRTQ